MTTGFAISASDFVCYIKDTTIGRGSISDWEYLDNGRVRKPGVMVKLDCRMEDYCSDKEYCRRSADVYFIMCGNTNVFMYVATRHLWPKELPLADFKNTSNHDSCWRSDGIGSELTRLYFQWAKEINPNKAPKDIGQHCIISLNKHRLCTVTFEPDPTSEHRGWNRLVAVDFEKG